MCFMTLQTDDCSRDYQVMKEKGVKFYGEPTEQMWGIEVVFEDLYGNLYDLVQRVLCNSYRKSLTQPSLTNKPLTTSFEAPKNADDKVAKWNSNYTRPNQTSSSRSNFGN